MIDVISVIAKLNILTASEGGHRKGSIKSGYRPNHVFELIDNMPLKTQIGEITFEDYEFIYTGEERIVTVKFLNVDEVKRFIHTDAEWWIYEGRNLIAQATVLKLL